jgi:hypothetical protein
MKAFKFRKISLSVSTIALAVFTSLPASANLVSINFDNVAAGTAATSAAPSGIEFFQAHYVNDLDAFGDEMPNTQKWQVDAENNSLFPVTVENPLLNGYGSAPSGSNALDARFQPVLMHFGSAQNLNSFSVTLDNSSFGNLSQSMLYFLDSSKTILGQLSVDQTVQGLIVNLSSPLNGVQEILLSSGAFYDDISFENMVTSPVPLPATFPLLLTGLSALGFLRRFRR